MTTLSDGGTAPASLTIACFKVEPAGRPDALDEWEFTFAVLDGQLQGTGEFLTIRAHSSEAFLMGAPVDLVMPRERVATAVCFDKAG